MKRRVGIFLVVIMFIFLVVGCSVNIAKPKVVGMGESLGIQVIYCISGYQYARVSAAGDALTREVFVVPLFDATGHAKHCSAAKQK